MVSHHLILSLLTTMLVVAVPNVHADIDQADIDLIKTGLGELKTTLEKLKRSTSANLGQITATTGKVDAIQTLLDDKIEGPLAAVNLIVTGNKTDIYQKKSIKKANIGLTINFFQLTVLFIYVLAITIYAVVKRVKRGNAEQMELQFEMIQKRLEDKMNERESKPRRQRSDKAPSTSMA